MTAPASYIPCSVNDCTERPFITHPLPLCRRDALTVSLNVTDVLHANALAGTATTELNVDRAAVAPSDVWQQPSHPAVVYFIANGDRVKIGTSTNIAARVGTLSLRRSNALLLLEGGHDLENALHKHFDADRIGRTEWFALSPQIRHYIDQRITADAAMRQPPAEAMETGDSTRTPPTDAPSRKPPTARERILDVLEQAATPPGPDGIYLHKDQISELAGVTGYTLSNVLTQLVKAGLAHREISNAPHGSLFRGRDVRGNYGLGAGPARQEEEKAA